MAKSYVNHDGNTCSPKTISDENQTYENVEDFVLSNSNYENDQNAKIINRTKTSGRIEQSDCKKEHILDNNTGDDNQNYYCIEEQHETCCNSDIYESIEVQAVKPTHCASTHLTFKSWRGKRWTCFLFGFLLLGVIVGMTAFMLLKNNSQDPDKQNTQAQESHTIGNLTLIQIVQRLIFRHSSLQQKTENITNYKGFTETNGHTTKEDACVSYPCLNGGTCVTAGCSYYCICPKGITGYKCAVTPCTSSPCLNNGECKVKNDTYQCHCPVGFNGPECQETPCSVEPCFYNGTCTVLGSSFNCACTEGYNGSRCEVTPCSSSPCLNGGTCTPTGSSFICSCVTGYFGNQCQVQRSCQYGWKMHEDKCYYFSSSNKNWRGAKSACQNLNSMLAEPKQMSDINFLNSNAKKFRKTFWLGGSDLATEGVWVWTTSGQGFTVTDWHTRTVHEPNNNNGNEHCLDMHKNLDYEWNDDNCWNQNRFICEKPLE